MEGGEQDRTMVYLVHRLEPLLVCHIRFLRVCYIRVYRSISKISKAYLSSSSSSNLLFRSRAIAQMRLICSNSKGKASLLGKQNKASTRTKGLQLLNM